MKRARVSLDASSTEETAICTWPHQGSFPVMPGGGDFSITWPPANFDLIVPSISAPSECLGTMHDQGRSGNTLGPHAIDEIRHGLVALGQAIGVVGGEGDLHTVVNVEPFRMVVMLLSEQRDDGHEGEGLFEITELDLGHGGVLADNVRPFGMIFEELRAGGGVEFGYHRKGARAPPGPRQPRR